MPKGTYNRMTAAQRTQLVAHLVTHRDEYANRAIATSQNKVREAIGFEPPMSALRKTLRELEIPIKARRPAGGRHRTSHHRTAAKMKVLSRAILRLAEILEVPQSEFTPHHAMLQEIAQGKGLEDVIAAERNGTHHDDEETSD